MIHKPIAIMILPIALAGILILAVLTAIPSNNHAFAFGNSFTFASPTSSEESNSTGNGQESNNTGSGQESSSSNTGSGQESNSTGSAQQQSNNAGTGPTSQASVPQSNSTASVPQSNNTTSPIGSTASNTTLPVNTTHAYCDSCNNDIYFHHPAMDLANMVLAVHNRERAAVGIPPVDPLVWSDKLAADAKVWAEHLATTGEFVHDTEHLPTLGEGENLAAMSWMGSHNTTVPIAQNMQGWVAEKNSYQGLPSATGTNVTGHYTQMVWRNTKEIGCATAMYTASGGGRDILVCRYSPPGNIVGQKPY
jgi:hypothetical protein